VNYEHCKYEQASTHKYRLCGTVVIFNRKAKMLKMFQSTLVEVWTRVCPAACVWKNVP